MLYIYLSRNNIHTHTHTQIYMLPFTETNSELSLLTINTLQKDSKDGDPIIRGLALRSFCNLKLSNLFEYIETPLFNGLNDKNSYVRRIAIICCVKLIKTNPQISIKNDIIKILKSKLLDQDPQCIINAVHALNEILFEEGGLKLNKAIIFNMLNKIYTFNEWGKCVVLNIVSTYIPENEDEMYDIMNILENHIRDFSSAVFLACLKCFINFSMNYSNLQIKIFQRMQEPLLTLISTSSYEVSYILLLHAHLLLHQANKLNCNIYDYDYKHFFFRNNDLTYIKDIKLDILVSVASKKNVVFIIDELSEYISDDNIEVAQKAIYSIGRIALKIPKSISRVVDLALSYFLPMNVSHICSATIKMLVDILRKYEEYNKVIIEEIIKYDNKLIDNVGIISYIWIIGEYCEYIEDAPYILEDYVEKIDGSYLFMLELLTASLKVLYRRPSEMINIVSTLFDNILKNYKYPELTDKLYFYYRILSYNYEEAFNIIACKKKVVKNFCEFNENILLDKLYTEFNTLSILYKHSINKNVDSPNITLGGIYDPEDNNNYSENNTCKDDTESALLYDSNDFMQEHNINKLNTNENKCSKELKKKYNLEYNNEKHKKKDTNDNNTVVRFSNMKENDNNLLNVTEDVLLLNRTNSPTTSSSSSNNNGILNESGTKRSTFNQHSEAYNMNAHSDKINNIISNKNAIQNELSESQNKNESVDNISNSKNFKKLKEILIDPDNINPEKYQEQWNLLAEQNNEKIYLRNNYYNLQLETIDELISKYNIITLASGEIENCLKFYMYSQLYTKHYIFIELIFNKVQN
uniref:AP complex subunit beta n=1 Tax=Piliocolobus tephrosceles TaxID=591936 RepID=A0A8C9GK29_9PRIM